MEPNAKKPAPNPRAVTHKSPSKAPSQAARLPQVRREFSAGFVLFRRVENKRLYLLLDYGKHWDFTKGHLEQGENSWEAAVRELEEETGIKTVQRVGNFSQRMYYEFFSPKKGLIIRKTVTYFIGQTTCATVKFSKEHEGYEWLEYDAARARLTYQNAKDLLQAAELSLQTTPPIE
jgi:8-oxo-dGTP pyrophosphatase MutT (NUDIX family)